MDVAVGSARVLEVAPVTIGRWPSEGRLPYAMTLFRRDDVLDLAERLAHTVRPGGARPSRRRR